MYMCDTSLYNTVLNYAPKEWDKSVEYTTRREFTLNSNSEEYKKIEYETKLALGKPNDTSQLTIKRNQNIHDLGQMLIKEQMLIAQNPGVSYYKGRRYICINARYEEMALKYNLDRRRCGNTFTVAFDTNVSLGVGYIVFAVQTIMSSKNQRYITPQCSDEYYIEYIITYPY